MVAGDGGITENQGMRYQGRTRRLTWRGVGSTRSRADNSGANPTEDNEAQRVGEKNRRRVGRGGQKMEGRRGDEDEGTMLVIGSLAVAG